MSTDLLQPGGGLTKSKLALADATAGDVLSGKKFYAGDKVLKTGTMTNNGNWTGAVSGSSVKIPKGYHSGNGKVTAKIKISSTSFNPGTNLGSRTFNVVSTFGIPDSIAAGLTSSNFLARITNGYPIRDLGNLNLRAYVSYSASTRILTVDYMNDYTEFTITGVEVFVMWIGV